MLISEEIVFIIRWVIVGALVLLIVSLVIFGRVHAKNRMKNSLPPLRYHRVSLFYISFDCQC